MLNSNFLVFGIITSLIYYEITGISPGGIIVPVYFGMYINDLKKILFTLLIAFLSFLIVQILKKFFIIFGRRQFVIYVIISLLLRTIFFNLLSMLDFSLVGVIIPGILGNEFEKNEIVNTVCSLIVVSVFIASFNILLL